MDVLNIAKSTGWRHASMIESHIQAAAPGRSVTAGHTPCDTCVLLLYGIRSQRKLSGTYKVVRAHGIQSLVFGGVFDPLYFSCIHAARYTKYNVILFV